MADLIDSLNALRMPTLSAAISGDLFKSWARTLLHCLPRPLRRYLALRRPRLIVQPRGDDAELMRELVDERETIGGMDLRTGGSLVANVGGAKQAWVEVVLELPSSQVLVRDVNLPVQVRDNLRRVVGYELDRLTPFKPEDVLFDVHAAGTVARGAKVRAELAVCRRDVVADWLDRLREAGAPASRLTWTGAWPGANLLPVTERPKQPRIGSWLTMGLLALVLGLSVATLVTPLWQRGKQQVALDRTLAKVRIQAEEVGQVRDALEQARLGSVEVLNRKRGQPRMTDLLREVTDLLPDDTWVQTLNYREGEVDIRGESSQATALIGLLEQGPGISGATFRSPVMQVANTGKERFHIAFTYTRPSEP
jgi:general secretion pathway protein L